MTLTEGNGLVMSSYIGSMCVLLPAVSVSCSSKALILALLLFKIVTITIMETATLTIKAVARELKLIDIVYTLLISELCIPRISVIYRMLVGPTDFIVSKMILIDSLSLLVIFPHTMVCIAKVHLLPFVCTLVQVTLVWLVVVGQLPQFDARML